MFDFTEVIDNDFVSNGGRDGCCEVGELWKVKRVMRGGRNKNGENIKIAKFVDVNVDLVQ